MKKIFLQVLCLFAINQSIGQVRVVEYFFDNDPGFGNADSIHFANPTSDTTFHFIADISSLSRGLHRLFVRSFDSTTFTWSHSSSRLFFRDRPQTFTKPDIHKAEYFFDSDPGFGRGIDIPLNQGQDIAFSFTGSAAGLTTGLHKLYVRTRNTLGRWSHSTSQIFYYEKAENYSAPNIVKAEFFFDNDPGFGNATNIPVTPGDDITFTFNSATAGLTAGLHKLFVRTRDASGNWSHTAPQIFYYEKAESYSAPNIVKAEFFFDNDPGFGSATNIPVTPGDDITFTFNSAAAGLTAGLHKLLVRTRDANGNWSHTAPQIFYYEKVESYSAPNIVKAEFFFDNDPGFGNGTNITVTPDDDITFTFNSSASGLTTGIHRLYVRTRDASGSWSHTAPQMFYYEKFENYAAPNIVKAEYYIDNDPGFGNGTNITVTPGDDITFSFNGDISSLTTGLHRLHIRTLDVKGNWSHTTPQLFYREIIESHTPGNLVKLEWFWDTDPGFGNANQVIVPGGNTEVTDINFNVPTPYYFSNEVHYLYVRVMPDWSHTTVTKVDFMGIVLPVTLLSFSAHAENERVLTSWRVTAEINMDKYIVEHSTDAIHFEAIGEVPATANGESEATYSLYHNNPNQGINYYRLRQVNIDGTYTYSGIATVVFSKGLNNIVIYPNPATTQFRIDSKERLIEIILLDITGKRLKKYPVRSEYYSLIGIPSGAYLIQIVLENNQVVTKPIIVEK